MRVEYVPLLKTQRDLYRIPRGTQRFETYLGTMLNAARDEPVYPPLVMINPMARDSVAAKLDVLAELGADAEAERIVREVAPGLPAEFEPLCASMVLVDDAGGGWTSRWATEIGLRIAGFDRKRPWIIGTLWSGEEPSIELVREAILSALLRVDDRIRRGEPKTIGEFLEREGVICARAGFHRPKLDLDEAEYTRDVLRPFLDEPLEPRLAVECLFGDGAARSLGFTPRGLGPWAGLTLAVEDAGKP